MQHCGLSILDKLAQLHHAKTCLAFVMSHKELKIFWSKGAPYVRCFLQEVEPTKL